MSFHSRLFAETILGFAEVAAELPPLRRGRPVSPSCVWRWATDGLRTPVGVIKLETTVYAGRTVTSRQAVSRFLAAVNAAKAGRLEMAHA